MKKSVKQIITSKVLTVINSSSLTAKQKAELIENIEAAINSRKSTSVKVKDGKVFDAFLEDYVLIKYMPTKKVKLKDGSIVERYTSMTKESARLKKALSVAEAELKDEVITLALESDKDNSTKIKKIQKAYETKVSKETKALLAKLNK